MKLKALLLILSLSFLSCNKAQLVEQENHPNDMFAAADPVRGKHLFEACSICHNVNKGQASETDGVRRFIGPNLFGVVGREIATVKDYQYSFVLEKYKNKKWTVERLSHFIKKPRKYAPGTTMLFNGIYDPQDRMDLIAYLNTLK